LQRLRQLEQSGVAASGRNRGVGSLRLDLSLHLRGGPREDDAIYTYKATPATRRDLRKKQRLCNSLLMRALCGRVQCDLLARELTKGDGKRFAWQLGCAIAAGSQLANAPQAQRNAQLRFFQA
jgi:hypothetical protein